MSEYFFITFRIMLAEVQTVILQKIKIDLFGCDIVQLSDSVTYTGWYLLLFFLKNPKLVFDSTCGTIYRMTHSTAETKATGFLQKAL